MKKLYRIAFIVLLLISNLSLWAQKADDYRAAANKGDKVAQFMLGSCYYEGSGVAQNYKQAVYWYTKSAGQGFAAAQFGLGVCYESGDGVAQDYKQAIYWYTKAANQGFADAQYLLGVFYESGDGVAQDYKQAIYWCTKAANQGHADAQTLLGLCYSEGEEDYTQAVYWYTKAANQGHAGAQTLLGLCYSEGDGVARDDTQAVYWYTKAANQGNAMAQYNLGRCYENGNGVEKNINKAIEWYTKAAEKGYVDSQYKLGEMYNYWKTIKNLNKAIYWYSKAAEQGHENALPRLGYCYEEVMTASPKDKTIESLQTICPIEIKVKGLKGDRDKADYTKPMTVVFKPGYIKTGVKETADVIVMEMQLYDDENKLICDEFFTNVSFDNYFDEIVLNIENSDFIISVDLNHPNNIDIYEYDWSWWYYFDYYYDDYDFYYSYSIKTNDLSWVDYLANWAYYNSYYSCIEANAEIKSDVMNSLKTVAEKYPNGITTQRKKELPTFNQLQKRIETNFGISNYFDPVTKDELTGKTPSARSSQTTNNSSSSSNSASTIRPRQGTNKNGGVNSNTSTNYQPIISAEKKKTMRFNETNTKDCNIADLVRHPLGNTHINPITLTKREFKSILKEEYPNVNVKEDKYDDFGFWDDQVPSYLAFRGKRVRSCDVDFIDKDLSGFRYYFTFNCNDYSKEDVMAFTEIICDELKLAGATLETKKLGENYVLDYGGKLDGHSIHVSMTKYENSNHYGVHLSTYPTRSYYASTSNSSSSTSNYKSKYSRWPYYYSNPICGFRLGYVQRSLRVTGGDLDEPVHIDMFGEENEVIPGFQLGFLFDPSDWMNMGMFGLNTGVNFEMFFNKWDSAPSNYYDKYMEMNLNFPLDLTFHIPFSSESALYLHGGLAIDWGIYNRLTYSRNSNIEPLTDVFCKHWIDNLNLSYEYGVDLRMKVVMLSLNYQKGFYGHPVFENYTTTIDKLSLGLSFVF